MCYNGFVPRKTAILAAAAEDLYLIDIPTAARRMSTTVFAVRELLRSGQIKFLEIGHKWLMSPKAIEEFIEKNQGYGK
jgi:excisionase family DNA binding protein